VSELVGSATLARVLVRDLRGGEERPLETTALFVLIGSTPQTTWLQGQIPLDEKGFVRTGSAGQAGVGMYETGRPGVFAVGDVRSGSVKRVASAVGEGAIAVRQVHDFLGAAGRR
jgi:thioredoxin reductase (NADPH)